MTPITGELIKETQENIDLEARTKAKLILKNLMEDIKERKLSLEAAETTRNNFLDLVENKGMDAAVRAFHHYTFNNCNSIQVCPTVGSIASTTGIY
jgi:hypothetical protein